MKNLTKQDLLSLIRHILSGVGGYLISHSIINASFDYQAIIGLIVTIVSFVWSWMDKTVTKDAISGVIRQTLSVVGGILVSFKGTTNFDVETIMGIITLILPFILKFLGKENIPDKQINS